MVRKKSMFEDLCEGLYHCFRLWLSDCCIKMSKVSQNSSNVLKTSNKSEGTSIQVVSDPSQEQATTVKFDSNNYLTWSKSVLIYIQGKYNEDYLTGEVEVPLKSDTRYRKWKIENAMVVGWLLNSMKVEINEHYLFFEIAHQILEALSKAYSEIGHATKVYELAPKNHLVQVG